MKAFIREALRRTRPELLYPYPAPSLQPERLHHWLDALYERRHLDGAIVEIGCWLGGTAAMSARMLQRLGSTQRYVCVDTFSGFVDGQYDGATADRHLYDRSSEAMVRRLLNRYDAANVELVQGDICTLSPDQLPDRVVACLLDVDVEEPTFEGLSRIIPKLVRGGIVLVDDCPAETPWVGARRGYERYCESVHLSPVYRDGLGVVLPITGSAS